MRPPWGRQVPVTSAASGLVLVAVLFKWPDYPLIAGILGVWAAVYVFECLARDSFELRQHSALSELRAATLSIVLFAAAVAVQVGDGPSAVPPVLYAACYVTAGLQPLVVGLRAARRGVVDVELLMVVAALCAAGTGKVQDGAALFVIFAVARALAVIAANRTERSIHALLDAAPQSAERVEADGGVTSVPAASLVPADRVLVRPGSRVPADGIVVDGSSDLDESGVTGEPFAAPKHPGDQVFAGSLNGLGALTVRVTRASADSVLAEVAAQVERATTRKTAGQDVFERLERRYSIGLLVVAAVLLFLPLSLGADPSAAVERAMAFVIVASPCALTLSTMPAMLGAIGNAGRHGVLVRDAAALERAARLTGVAFDKTGSLTSGEPYIADVTADPSSGLDADAVLRFAASAELGSEHPVGAAIRNEASERGLDVPAPTSFRARPGFGVSASVDGRLVEVRSSTDASTPTEPDGMTTLVVNLDAEQIGTIAITDRVRPSAVAAIDQLRKITIDEPVLLTGDNPSAAAHIGRQVGIDSVRARLLPADKAAVIAEYGAGGKRVGYVGDGINDAPALATAEVGITVAQGADLAIETSDVVLLRSDLTAIPALINTARTARRVVRQNLVFAASVIVVLVAVDLFGLLALPVAVVGHEASSLLVALNGMRLIRTSSWRAEPRSRPRLRWEDLQRRTAPALLAVALTAYATFELCRSV